VWEAGLGVSKLGRECLCFAGSHSFAFIDISQISLPTPMSRILSPRFLLSIRSISIYYNKLSEKGINKIRPFTLVSKTIKYL